MAQRVRRSHRGHSPSSVTQLPILTALHAGFPTLFPHIIHHTRTFVNPISRFLGFFLPDTIFYDILYKKKENPLLFSIYIL
jgi:hypothetical protein